MSESPPGSRPPFGSRRRQRLRLIATGVVAFLLLEGALLALLPSRAGQGVLGFIGADALLAVVVCGVLAFVLRKG